ncbi:Myosin regulatory light chain 10 [Microtus ochrogaster]|uniref:Myosin regulatory light chain 10 n=1 Tax=Microtus ochrogaster TaxID=79684 RepID=A0A8J6KQE1_MICOH|nr:Myosin regulatory light chain 10 [Microtus ochrogaster]
MRGHAVTEEADSFQGLIEYLHDVAMAEDNSEEAEKEQQASLSVADEEAPHNKLSNTAPRRARKRAEGTASSNVFSMFDQSQIQEFKEAFTIMDQNRDGFIDKEDLRDTFAALGRINVKNEELEAMVKEAPGPINFTVFLTMFGEKLKGTDPEETILHAFKVFDTEGKGFVKADFIKEKLMTQADRFSEEEVKQMFAAFPPDVCGNLDYRNLCYVITHGEEKD